MRMKLFRKSWQTTAGSTGFWIEKTKVLKLIQFCKNVLIKQGTFPLPNMFRFTYIHHTIHMTQFCMEIL